MDKRPRKIDDIHKNGEMRTGVNIMVKIFPADTREKAKGPCWGCCLRVLHTEVLPGVDASLVDRLTELLSIKDDFRKC